MWATKYINELKDGKAVSFRPFGKSMSGLINSGQLCTVSPLINVLNVGDIVLCKVNGKEYLHLIKKINGNNFLIGNNIGRINGWISKDFIFGKCIKIE